MTSTHARIARAVFTGAAVFSLAAGAHLAGGAALPSPLILAGLAGLTLLAVTVFARRKFSVGGVLAILGGGQVLLHEAFSALTTTTACVPASRGHFGSQQVHCAPADVLEHAHGFSLVDDPLMFLTHAIAVLVTALMLAHGETALELALRWLRPLAALPQVAAYPSRTELPRTPERPTRNYLSPLLDMRPLRGPPLSPCS